MNFDVHSEGFELTESIRESVRLHAEQIGATIPSKTSLQIYLKKEANHVFSITFKAHVWKRDVVVHDTGPDLYTLIVDAAKTVESKIHKLKEKHLDKTRRHQLREVLKDFESVPEEEKIYN
jgi:ribosome-associated translation inhibitor RaiA